VPTLRFPEFRDAGEWVEKSLGEFIEEFREKSSIQDEFEVLTSSRSGLVKQREYYDNDRITERDNVGFNIIPPDYLTYRSRSDDRRFYFNENNLNITGIVSVYYPVFRMRIGDNKFFVKLFSHYSDIIGKYSVGTSQTVLSLNELKRINMPIPSLPEQQKIAACLSSLDELITAHSKKLDALKKHKKGLMQQLFPAEGQTVPSLRFPEFQDAGEWVEKKLGEIIVLEYGSPLPEQKRNGGLIPVVGSNGVVGYHDNALITAPAIVIGRKGSAGQVNWIALDCYPIDTTFYVKNKNPESYLLFFLKLTLDKIKLETFKDNGAVPGINRNEIHSIKIALPDFPEQQKIAAGISSLDELITAHSKKLDALKKHKKGLMQQLFPVVGEE